MLAQNFKTAADLGITDADYDALNVVLRMLEREEFGGAQTFDMSSWNIKTDCGTAACIAGWAHILSAGAACLFVGEYGDPDYYPEAAQDLFLPFRWEGNDTMTACRKMQSIKPAQAAIALRNYLTFGEPRWSEALAG